MPTDRFPIDGHPGFYSRGGRIEFRFRDKKGKRRWRRARTIKEAQRLRAELETDVARGEYRETSRQTVAGYGRIWIETYTGRTSKPIGDHTRADYRTRLEEAFAFFEGMRMVEVEPQDIKSYAASLASRPRQGKRYAASLQTLSPNTVRLGLAPIKAMFATAFEEGVIRVNPAAGVRIATPRHESVLDEDEGADVKALTSVELVAVLAAIAARSERWLLFFRVLVSLGLRFSEISELRWRDVDLGQRTVKIRRGFYRGKVGRPKSKYGIRTLKLTPDLSRALWALRKETKARADDLVFTGVRGGRVNSSSVMTHVLKPAAVDAGLGSWKELADDETRAESWVGFHTFRHTCATLLFLEAKWNAKQVQMWLGHHSAAFTLETYIHLLPSDLPEPPTLDGFPLGTTFGTSEARDDRKSDVAGPHAVSA